MICNGGSGRNTHESDAIDEVMLEFGPEATLIRVKQGQDITKIAQKAVDDGYGTLVAAGGDGTIMAVASVLAGSDARLAVLPLGTFNFFARGLGASDDLAQAARDILNGTAEPMSLGEMNGRLFLNNASIGVYPAILQERETVYKRFGRFRLAAHWSTLRTFVKFQRPLHVTIEIDGQSRKYRTPLVFVARSAFQLDYFGIEGGDAVRDGKFAVYVCPDRGRWGLLKGAWRLALGRMEVGKDVELICADALTIRTKRKRQTVACDGEKLRLDMPLEFRIRPGVLQVVKPARAEAAAA